MSVQPSVSPEQIVTIVAFILLLLGVLWFIKRNRSGIAGRLHAERRMTHIEDLSLAPQQRLHLIEVDGRAFLVHVGKGHAAGFMPVDGKAPMLATATPSAQLTEAAGKPAAKAAGKAKDAVADKPKSAFSAAIAQARRNNPNLRFGK